MDLTGELLSTDYLSAEGHDDPRVKTTRGDLRISQLVSGDELVGVFFNLRVEGVTTVTTHTYVVHPYQRTPFALSGEQKLALVLIRPPQVVGPTLRWVDDLGSHSLTLECQTQAIVEAKTKPQPGTPYDLPASDVYLRDDEWRSAFALRYALIEYPFSQAPVKPLTAGIVASIIPDEYLKNSSAVRLEFLQGLMTRAVRGANGEVLIPKIRNLEELLRGLSFSWEEVGGYLSVKRPRHIPFEISYEGFQTSQRLTTSPASGAYLAEDGGVRWV